MLYEVITGRIGTKLEALSWLAGFDWRTNIALVGGFAAKEVIEDDLFPLLLELYRCDLSSSFNVV